MTGILQFYIARNWKSSVGKLFYFKICFNPFLQFPTTGSIKLQQVTQQYHHNTTSAHKPKMWPNNILLKLGVSFQIKTTLSLTSPDMLSNSDFKISKLLLQLGFDGVSSAFSWSLGVEIKLECFMALKILLPTRHSKSLLHWRQIHLCYCLA